MEKASVNKKSYNKIVTEWAKIRNNSSVNKPIIDFSQKIKPNGNILDIGCGTGNPIAKYFSENYHSVIGIDFSEKMIEIAKSQEIKNAQFIVSDFFDFETDKKFDGIIAWDSLFHFPKKRQEEIYSKVYNLLLPNGYFLFTHGKEKDDEHTDQMFGEPFYYSCLSRDNVLRIMTDLGFRLEYEIENFVEENTQRDWVVLVQKK
ncbi:class I SAM-dependent methyltransferase [Flavobacterium sp. LC2016-01]|uniref:class I SAM-dependent DNA methyltransferase n=1 Tax=Flavobacterium sp. LC2016-01 TaxID=2675876 RepID=UPI0012BAABDB|nr:class I SAM-dependent methyltransferase [Flavobacterium sp. LC2016-01]MTH16756.1 methyltransferase domain-containing protein [Flavobacterium sp. LC2016-01]